MERARSLLAGFKGELRVYSLVLRHPRTPRISRMLLGIAIAYAVSPIDLDPDFIPVVGQLDDAVLLPILVWTALRFLPQDVIQECRRRGQLIGNPQRGVAAEGHACFRPPEDKVAAACDVPGRAVERARGYTLRQLKEYVDKTGMH